MPFDIPSNLPVFDERHFLRLKPILSGEQPANREFGLYSIVDSAHHAYYYQVQNLFGLQAKRDGDTGNGDLLLDFELAVPFAIQPGVVYRHHFKSARGVSRYRFEAWWAEAGMRVNFFDGSTLTNGLGYVHTGLDYKWWYFDAPSGGDIDCYVELELESIGTGSPSGVTAWLGFEVTVLPT